MKNIVKDKMLLLITAVFIFSMGVAAISQAQIKKPDNEREQTVAKTFSISVPDFADTSDDKIEDITNNISSQQRQIGRLLLWQLQYESRKLSNAQKSGIIETLGNIRFVNAVSILIEDINFKKKLKNNTGTSLIPTAPGPNRYPYVARTALEGIGDPSSSYIIDILDKIPSQLPADFVSSRAEGFTEVLYDIDGPRYGLLKLQDHQQAASDPQVKAQYQMVIDRFKKIVAQTQ